MKIFPTTLHADIPFSEICKDDYIGELWNTIKKYSSLEEVADVKYCDVVFIFLKHHFDFKFDFKLSNQIYSLKKPIVIFDFTEYGDTKEEIRLREYNIFGYNVEFEYVLRGDLGIRNDFLIQSSKLIKCYFKRELSASKNYSVVPFNVFPIEFISDAYHINNIQDTFDQYQSRPIIFSYLWGNSNVSRYHLHGILYQKIEEYYCGFATSFPQAEMCLRNYDKDFIKFILTVQCDWFERTLHNKMMKIFNKSYMVIDVYGCGMKCFRNVESSSNSVSIKQDPSKLIYTYPWVDKENCIVLPCLPNSNLIDIVKSHEILLNYRIHHQEDILYKIYLKSMETSALYAPENYVPNHIIKNINISL